MKKATEDQFSELNNLVTTEFLSRIKSGEASTQDLKVVGLISLKGKQLH